MKQALGFVLTIVTTAAGVALGMWTYNKFLNK